MIAYVARLKPQLISTLETDLALQPTPSNFLQRGIGALFQSESTSTPEERRERFYNWLSVFGSLVIFGTFFIQSGLVSFGFDESASERSELDA